MTRLAGVLWFGCLAVVLSCMAGTAFGGEEKPLDEMSVEELRTYQGYYYPIGGRDPLTMRMPTSSELGQDKEGEKAAPTLEQMEMELGSALERITIALKAQDFEGAIKIGDEIINIVDNEWPELKADPPHLKRMDEEIRNYHRMAIRLKTNKDIQNEFDAMQLRVEGVIWSPTDAKAVVNGRLLSAGEVMLNERKQGDLRVEMIEEHGVIFQFRGMRFRIPVDIYAQPR